MSIPVPHLSELPDDQRHFASVQAIRHLYTSACVNRRSGCMSVLPVNRKNGDHESLLAFGSSHLVCLARLLRSAHGSTTHSTTVPTFHISRMLHGHESPVNAVRWIELPKNHDQSQWPYALLLSLDTSGKVLVWCCHLNRLVDQGTGDDWSVLLDLQLPKTCATNAIDGCLIVNSDQSSSGSVLLVVDVAADTTLHSWHVNIESAPDTLPMVHINDPVVAERKPSMCLCLRSVCLALTASDAPLFPQSSLHFIIVGLDNGMIEIWSEHISTCSMPAACVNQDLTGLRQLLHSATLFGHTDWVRCLDVAVQSQVTIPPMIYVASGGQDNMVRLWRMYSPVEENHLTAEDQRSTLKVADLKLPDSVKLNLSVASESVLSSHENWITGVSWELRTVTSRFPPALLSSSMDRSLIVWAPPNQKPTSTGDEVQLWLEKIRVGDVGGTGLGFLDCGWLVSGPYRAILGQNFQGSVSLWTCEADAGTWSPGLPLSGHSGPVADLTWSKTSSIAFSSEIERTNSYSYRVLLTAGSDQTVRIHGPRRILAAEHHTGDVICGSKENCLWQELARPQVHGYDMNAVASLSPISYVSAGDEKVVRVFKATRAFLAAYEDSVGVPLPIADQSLAQGAVQPTLGLSNQVAASGDADYRPTDSEENLSSSPLTPLPTEDRLQHATLWPEVKKLYGHAYEIYCLAAHPHLMLVASASVATKPAYAFIILWNGYADWTIHARLMHHQLTVTQMIWSHHGHALLAVSRDRTWSVWVGVDSEQNNVENALALPTYHLSAHPAKGKSHSRIIWTGAWSPDDRYFFTGSRDKTILVWNAPSIGHNGPTVPVACVPLDVCKTFTDAVTALDIIELPITTSATEFTTSILAVGLESGQLLLFLIRSSSAQLSSSSGTPQLSWSDPIPFPAELCHVKNKRVRRVAFEPCPLVSSTKPMTLSLATAADDGFVHLFEITPEKLNPNF